LRQTGGGFKQKGALHFLPLVGAKNSRYFICAKCVWQGW
jgi:hypothetical protein